MTFRLIGAAAGAIACFILLIALAAAWGVFDPPAAPPAIRPAPIGPAGWKETRRYSVNRVVIIEGESPYPERAAEIARELIEPGSGRYDEVLVYVRPPGDRSRTWRVQWTKAGGFKVIAY